MTVGWGLMIVLNKSSMWVSSIPRLFGVLTPFG